MQSEVIKRVRSVVVSHHRARTVWQQHTDNQPMLPQEREDNGRPRLLRRDTCPPAVRTLSTTTHHGLNRLKCWTSYQARQLMSSWTWSTTKWRTASLEMILRVALKTIKISTTAIAIISSPNWISSITKPSSISHIICGSRDSRIMWALVITIFWERRINTQLLPRTRVNTRNSTDNKIIQKWQINCL